MSSFLEKIFGRDRNSANEAKERLKFVLIHDRTDLTPTALQSMKDELIAVISKYVEIDPLDVKIEMEQDGREQRLLADIPLKQASRRKK